jgi:hypothetical protein
MFDTCKTNADEAWSCYTAVEGDTLQSIAAGPKSFTRNVSMLTTLNANALYGQDVHVGMDLKLPRPFCGPSLESECATLAAPLGSLDSIAHTYGTTAQAIASMNKGTLGGDDLDKIKLTRGMELRVPRRTVTLMPPVRRPQTTFTPAAATEPPLCQPVVGCNLPVTATRHSRCN